MLVPGRREDVREGLECGESTPLYRVVFEHVPLREKFARISVNHEGKIAPAAMASEISEESAEDPRMFDAAAHAKHEAIHLFLSRFASLAHSRFLMERELYDCEEGMVRVLEKVL